MWTKITFIPLLLPTEEIAQLGDLHIMLKHTMHDGMHYMGTQNYKGEHT